MFWIRLPTKTLIPGPLAQSVASPIADPVVMSLIPAWSHTFIEINHKIFSTVNLLLPLIRPPDKSA